MMAFLDNWRLPMKMAVASTIFYLLLCFLAYDNYASSKAMDEIAREQSGQNVAGLSELANVRNAVKDMRILTSNYYIASSAGAEASLKSDMERTASSLNTALDNLEKLDIPEFDGDLQALRQAVEALQDVDGQIIEKRTARDKGGTLALLGGEGLTRSAAAADLADRLFEKLRDRTGKLSEVAAARTGFAQIFLFSIAVMALAILVGMWLAFTWHVTRPMARITEVTATLAKGGEVNVPYRHRQDEIGQIAGALEQFRKAAETRAEDDARQVAEQRIVTSSLSNSLAAISNGDLTRSIDVEYPETHAELKIHFNNALASLRELIGTVVESTATIRTGSGEIAQASEDLARRTESNAASLEETSAAITQMDDRLRNTAAAASRTVERADGATSVVASGRRVADEAVQAMGRVSESAKGIDSVIEGLDKIAFQTRVLAMNAAVEAGRAGDAGRGFAVVADLVSALAMRSEEEAKRAREQLTATQTDIGTAVEAVQKVDGALQGISSDVAEVHKLLGGIAADNQAQSSTITEISAAIGTMDQAIQQNAAMVEETSAAARNLSSEVATLSERASLFQFRQSPARKMAAPVPKGFVPVGAPPLKPMSERTTTEDWTDF